MMTEQLEKWIESWWEEPERPETIQEKQIWTIFLPGDGETREGTVIAVLSAAANACLVVPLHEELEASAQIEPVLTGADLSFAASMSAVVQAAVTVSPDAFAEARFLGELGEAAFARVRETHQEFLVAAQSISELQALEAEHGPEGIPEADLQRALSAGVLKLVPQAADSAALVAFHDQLLVNLKPYQIAGGQAAAGADIGIGLDLNLEAEHYKSIIEFLDHELPGLSREKINHAARPAGGRERARDLNLLAVLVYARTGQWNRVEQSLRGLMDSGQSDVAELGMTWLKQNLNREIPGAPSLASGAPEFYEQLRISDPDREMGKILKRLGHPLAVPRRK